MSCVGGGSEGVETRYMYTRYFKVFNMYASYLCKRCYFFMGRGGGIF